MSIYEFRQALINMDVDNIETDDAKFNRILLVVDIDGDEQIDIEEFKVACALVDADLTGPKTKHLRVRIVLILGFCWCALGAIGFAYVENWKISESIYFTVTTLTAIGLGDYVRLMLLLCVAIPLLFYIIFTFSPYVFFHFLSFFFLSNSNSRYLTGLTDLL